MFPGLAKVLGSAALIGLLTQALHGQEKATTTQDRAPEGVPRSLAGIANITPAPLPPCTVPAELDDPAFTRFADLLLLGQAWDYHDSALLTDIALQLAEGERVLLRPHKALDAGRLLELAAAVASDRKDAKSLDRIERAARARSDHHLVQHVASCQRLASTADESEKNHVGSLVEVLSPEAVVLHQVVVRKLRAARLAGDGATFDKLDNYLRSLTDLDERHLHLFEKLIAKARAGKVEKSRLAETIKVLDQLAAITPCAKTN